MKKICILILLVTALFVVCQGVSKKAAVVAADVENNATEIKAGNTVKNDFDQYGAESLYYIHPEKIGLLTITVKGYIQDNISISVYSPDNKKAVLTDRDIPYDAGKGYSYKQYQIYVGPRTYYINLSHSISIKKGSYEIDTEFKEISTCELTGINNNQDYAVALGENNFQRGIVAFDEEKDYYRLNIQDGHNLKFHIISEKENSEVYVEIQDQDGRFVTSFLAKDTVYDKEAVPGNYIIIISKIQVNDLTGIPYKIITGDYIGIDSIKIPTSKTLTIGGTYTISPVLAPASANEKYTYKSSDTKIAKVSSSGKVTALKKGTATITVTSVDGKIKSNKCKITVNEILVSAITLNRTSATLKVGDNLTLIATIYPNNATNKTVTWKSSNTKVATVSSNGKVTAKAAGVCTITVTAGTKSARATIGVKSKVTPTEAPKVTQAPKVTEAPKNIPIKSLKIDKSSYTISIGAVLNISVTISPSNATDKSLVWTSSDSSVVSVTNGKVTGLKSGDAVITVKTKDNKVMARCTIYVD